MPSEHGKPVIVFVDHHENPMDDRAWTHLGALGYDRRLVCPFRGETLGAPGPEVAGTVIYGGAQSANDQDLHPFLGEEIRWIERCMEGGLPVLGLCLGGQLLARVLGARVRSRTPRECEFGYYPLTPTTAGRDWLPDGFHATEAHYEEFDIPAGAVHLAASERFPHQAFRYGDNALGLQFHPEIDKRIFRRWQAADWAMFGIPGAQERHEQDHLMKQHDEAQGIWFHGVLEALFGTVPAPVDPVRPETPGRRAV